MFPSGPFDFFYAPHNRVASTVRHMTLSLTDPFMVGRFASLFRLTFTTVSGRNYFVPRRPMMLAAAWTNLSASLPGTAGEVGFTPNRKLTSSGWDD